jgi:hypothetical protein
LVAHNASDASLIGIEMLCESGPDFKKAADRHVRMLKKYTAHMEDKYFAGFLRVFCDEYSPTKGFERALKTLEDAQDSSQEECARAIWLAGEQVEQYCMKATGFPKLGPSLRKYQNVPDELVGDIEKALAESEKSLERFENDRTLKNAVFLCEDDRRTMLLVFLARAAFSSGHNDRFDAFQKIVQKARGIEEELSGKPELSDLKKQFFDHIARSEERRIRILGALRVGDMHRARTLMWETIEKAYHERPLILEFTAEVDYGKGWERPSS